MKLIKQKDVASLIKDGDMVAISGSGGSGSPEALLKSISDSFVKTGHPKGIGVTCGISPGNLTEDEVGMNILAKDGLISKAICAHLGMGRLFGKMVGENKFPAFAIPLGVINHLYRASAGKEVGIITHVGLDTCVDPRLDGGRANESAKKLDPIVEVINIAGKENLFYHTFPINVALIKATYSDSKGNISFEEEGVIGEQYNMALAASNNGGIVIVEVKGIKENLKAKDVLIHGAYVDYVVISKPNKKLGEYNLPIYDKSITGEKKKKLSINNSKILDERKVCARRAAMELRKGDVVNLGVGMPDGVSKVALEEGILNDIYLSVETGPTGGSPVGGVVFGVSRNADSIIPTSSQFDAYNGGSLDMAILGLAEVDEHGNVNVSKFGTRVTGPGGFINITQSTHKVIFIGTFMAGNLEEEIKNRELLIKKEGEKIKFKNEIGQITFSAKQALKNNQEVLYITERCVFELTKEGLILTEIAPGIDLDKDILNHMEFKPIISSKLKEMDKSIYTDSLMDLKKIFY